MEDGAAVARVEEDVEEDEITARLRLGRREREALASVIAQKGGEERAPSACAASLT